MSGHRIRWDLGPGDRQAHSAATSPAAPSPLGAPALDGAPEADPHVSERSSRPGSVRVDFPAPTPDDFAPSVPQEFPGLFWGRNFPLAERPSVLDAIRRLPHESIVGQFARGACNLLPSPAGAANTEATVDKPWHEANARWNQNRHTTVQLEWMDERR
ncbi:hypothetical protein DPSP01_006119 [Paraphaeosphaeria sporulosa]